MAKHPTFYVGAHTLFFFPSPVTTKKYAVEGKSVSIQKGEYMLVVIKRGPKYEKTRPGFGFPGGHLEVDAAGNAEQPEAGAIRENIEELRIPSKGGFSEPLLDTLTADRMGTIKTYTDVTTKGKDGTDIAGTLAVSLGCELNEAEVKRVLDCVDQLYVDPSYRDAMQTLSNRDGKGAEFGDLLVVPVKDLRHLGLKFAYPHEGNAAHLLSDHLIELNPEPSRISRVFGPIVRR